jgi:hypothetical protein
LYFIGCVLENVFAFGNAFDMRSLARHAGLTERYIGKVFGCALLAPDIIESIPEGRQPHDLNFEKLCQHVPLRLDRAARPVWVPSGIDTASR